MKKTLLSALALMLLFSMLLGTFAACKDKPQDDPEQTTDDQQTTPPPEEEIVHESLLSGDYASLVENAYWLSNGVNTYFANPTRNAYTVENQKMKLNYSFDPEKPQQVTSLTTPGGKPYITDTLDSCDYPDYVAPAARAVASGECDKGIALCTTGIGVSIVCNKTPGIRCALLSDKMSARLTREHNDTNMMAMGAGVVGEMLALEIVDTWLGTEFSHNERHQRRIDKVMALEK